ncbi:MAG: glycoside hydrolase family 13 protein [Balneolaceae bacterium]|nr:glycoside hydrolase family 13 protein [Balneolaceae bacterium]
MQQPQKDITVKETREKVPYHTPEWAKHVIWYQIMPERFRNGDPSNDPTAERIGAGSDWELSPWSGDWYERAEWEWNMGPEFRDSVFYRRYGGDLQGIIDKLDYLKDLGIGALYLNPVFDAVSLHKYDTSHFHHVDRFFGPDPEGDARLMDQENPADPSTWRWTAADKLFLKLIEEVHRREMKIIIDGVFNHAGIDFWAFRDIVKHQEKSEFSDWFDIISFEDPDNPETAFKYNGWWGVKDLPEFSAVDHTLFKPVRDHLFDITRRWMDPDGDGDPSDGIDGWRLDVPEEVGQNFWIEWHELVRDINPKAFTVGEIWTGNAVNYVNREQFNAVMNYRFAATVQDFMIDRQIDAAEFAKQLREIRNSLPDESNYVHQNLMDSHDTPRLASMIVNPGREYGKRGKPEEGFDVRKPNDYERRVQKLISLLQYTYVGAPMIFYGTEAGMWGADDPDDRKPMVWPDMNYEIEKNHPLGHERPEDENNFDHTLHEWYRKLGEIRNEHQVFQTGRFELLLADPNREIYAFARVISSGKYAVVLLNRSDHTQEVALDLADFKFDVAVRYSELILDEPVAAEGDKLKIAMDPISGRVLLPQRH